MRPLHSSNKQPSNSFVEGHSTTCVCNGNVVTDHRGLAYIELPAGFAATRDIRYQLTVVGQFAQAVVLRKVQNNCFAIKTDKPRVEVSWQVTGIRNEAWANQILPHRLLSDRPANFTSAFRLPE